MKKILLLLITTQICCFIYSGDKTTDMFNLELSAKLVGLGGATVSLSGIDTIAINPASISDIQNKEVLLTYTRWLIDTSYGSINFVLPTTYGNFGIIINNFNSGEIEGYDELQTPTVDFSVQGILLGMIYSKKIKSCLTGITIKYIKQNLHTANYKVYLVTIDKMRKIYYS